MVIKSLIMGLIFTLGIFAVKSGIGLYYLTTVKKSFKTSFFSIFSYFMVFMLSYFIIVKINLLNYFGFFQSFLKSAMWIHILLAIGMIWWGINILTNIRNNTKAYLMLVLPCPFCSLSIFLALSFVVNFTGSYSVKWVLLLYLVFLIIQLLTIFLIKILNIKNINDFLGFSLIFVGVYFLITFCIAPVFTEIGRIYRLSKYSSSLNFMLGEKYILSYFLFFIVIFSGFIFRQLSKRKAEKI